MKIRRISAYQVDLPLREGSYSWSGQTFAAFDSTVVLVETDAGITGVGETCPLGPSYLPAYAEGARTGLHKLAPGLLGCNPLEIDAMNQEMERLLKGHPYVKSALDMAFWDIAGKAYGQPLSVLLGGTRQESVRLFKVISRAAPEVMAEKIAAYQDMGFHQFQMKVGEGVAIDIARIEAVAAKLGPDDVLGADANTGWRQHEAQRVVKAVAGIDLYIEQPCLSYEECLAVRRHCGHPMILDECMDSLGMVLRGHAEGAMDLINLKINRMGGLTRARQVRDLCLSLGIVMTIEDSWGGEIATAAIAHLAQSTPADFHFQSSAFHEYASICIADGGPEIADGFMKPGEGPGLGVTPRMEVLGDPVFVIE